MYDASHELHMVMTGHAPVGESLSRLEEGANCMLWRERRVWLLVLCVSLGWASLAHAQTGLATITGIVTDNSGAAVPGLTVTATGKETGVAYTGVTSSAGVYTITSVPIGAYVVTAEMQG